MAALPCFEIVATPQAKTVRLPGGVAIEAIDVIAQLQPALTPLVPILNIIEALIAVFKMASELPEKILTADLPGIFELIEEAAQKMAAVASLVPQISIPLMVVDMIDCIIIEIEKLQAIILKLQSEVKRIDLVRTRAQELGDPEGLLSIIDCADLNIQIELDNQLSTFQALSKLFAILELFLSILGVGSELLPSLSDLSGASLDEAFDILESFVEPLKTIRSLIPLG